MLSGGLGGAGVAESWALDPAATAAARLPLHVILSPLALPGGCCCRPAATAAAQTHPDLRAEADPAAKEQKPLSPESQLRTGEPLGLQTPS